MKRSSMGMWNVGTMRGRIEIYINMVINLQSKRDKRLLCCFDSFADCGRRITSGNATEGFKPHLR